MRFQSWGFVHADGRVTDLTGAGISTFAKEGDAVGIEINHAFADSALVSITVDDGKPDAPAKKKAATKRK